MHQRRQEAEPIFREAVSAVLAQWTLLNLAVEQGWGGRDSHRKRQKLYEDLIAEFRENKNVDVEDLACTLSERLASDFSVSVEDDSDLEVAQLLVDLHEQISRGCFDLASVVKQQQNQRATSSAKSQCGNAREAETDCSMSEGSDAEGELEDLISSVEIAPSPSEGIASQTRSRQTAGAASELQPAHPSEADGWTTVQAGSRRRPR
ncbi:hypothetical protein, conserved [Eimeria tenella]|uniref:Pre-rRNA-processing protein TSR2 n=1 Tax=Eimeria tenella TaxID=5802 RepID=H9BA01_EIMTE|nr:hypothetical protein, conserved [Eimeria tenella]AET50811.1 hypothetical protein [Eimeria tenella]CDJ40434.1 hypothetical protein, conserved [Eimeria tenella]|eukprot:XP_013231184.1 hypothetical protein, conserved [Eimeria tenella]